MILLLMGKRLLVFGEPRHGFLLHSYQPQHMHQVRTQLRDYKEVQHDLHYHHTLLQGMPTLNAIFLLSQRLVLQAFERELD